MIEYLQSELSRKNMELANAHAREVILTDELKKIPGVVLDETGGLEVRSTPVGANSNGRET